MRLGRSLTIPVAALLAGCALPPHSNTLLFATNTTVALDVSANATTAAPNITIGYKRQEMAWVPLLANKSGPAKERQPADCPPASTANSTDPCVFLGRDGTSADAYSVLATFSGTAAASGAGGTSSTRSANGSIAQFFATGLAARILADKGGAQLVNTGTTSATTEQLVEAFNSQEQTDTQKLNAYFSDTSKFTQLRDALVDNSQWKGTSTATSLKQQSDLTSFLNYARTNFLTHSLAAAIPTSTSPAPGGAPAGAAPPAAAPPAGAVPGVGPSGVNAAGNPR
jgi:hypothetical protein